MNVVLETESLAFNMSVTLIAATDGESPVLLLMALRSQVLWTLIGRDAPRRVTGCSEAACDVIKAPSSSPLLSCHWPRHVAKTSCKWCAELCGRAARVTRRTPLTKDNTV